MTTQSPHSQPFLSRFAPANLLLGAGSRAHFPRRFSTNAPPRHLSGLAIPAVGRALRQAGRWFANVVRESGVPQPGRFLILLALLSFATAWLGTRAVMASLDNTFTEVALVAARQENQQLRIRQETLREETEAALAAVAATEAAEAPMHVRYP